MKMKKLLTIGLPVVLGGVAMTTASVALVSCSGTETPAQQQTKILDLWELSASDIKDGVLTIDSEITTLTNRVNSNIAKSITSVVIESGSPLEVIPYKAFYDCNSLKTVTVNNNLKVVANAAFENCDSLTSVTLPNTVTSIDDYAFFQCKALNTINFPTSLTEIGDWAFSATALTNVDLSKTSVESIGLNGFSVYNSSNASITNLSFPNTLKSIGAGAFYHQTSLKSVVIPNSVNTISTTAGSISGAFQGCTGLTDVKFEDGGTTPLIINQYTFSGCSTLSSMILPSRLGFIGGNAFDGVANSFSLTLRGSDPKALDLIDNCFIDMKGTITVENEAMLNLVETNIKATKLQGITVSVKSN